MRLALKVDVDTYRGTCEGIPALLKCLDRHRVRGTFLFSLGPDHTGRALKRLFRPGFLHKLVRTSVASHIGLKTALYGVLLPGPDIGRKCADLLRSVRAAGHEVGIHTWDHVRWQDGVATASDAWTERELRKAVERFADIFGEPAKTHGAAGWQMNDYAFSLTEQLGFDYCSDGRGYSPFFPVVNEKLVRCPQIPTTLPTLDELLGLNGVNEHNAANSLLRTTLQQPSTPHVYTLHTEMEGMKLLPIFDKLLSGWTAQGYELTSVRSIYEQLDLATLPAHRIATGTVPGRSGTLCVQGARVDSFR